MVNFFDMWGVFFLLVFFFPFSITESACFKPVMVRNDKRSLPQHLKPLVVVDAGHGGADSGARVQYLMEKHLNLTTAGLVRKYLDALGYRVMLIRNKDVFIPLKRRALFANKSKASLFVSIHFNSTRSYSNAHGIEVYYFKNGDTTRAQKSFRLANDVLGELINQTKAFSRGVKHGNFHVIRETLMPAILVEGGFITHSGERGLLRDKRYLEKIAKGVAFGVDKYLRSSK